MTLHRLAKHVVYWYLIASVVYGASLLAETANKSGYYTAVLTIGVFAALALARFAMFPEEIELTEEGK